MTLVATPSAPVHAATAAGDYAQSAHQSTNNMRTARSLHWLVKSTCLKKFAVRQAKKMAARGFIFHQDLGVILRDCRLSITGENVASGYPTGQAAVAPGCFRRNTAPTSSSRSTT